MGMHSSTRENTPRASNSIASARIPSASLLLFPREQPEVPLHGDAPVDEGFHDVRLVPLELDGMGPRLHEPPGVGEGVLHVTIAVDGQVPYDDGRLDASGDGLGMPDHIIHRHLLCVLVPEDHHAEAVPHQDHVDARCVDYLGGLIVVSCQDGDLSDAFEASHVINFHLSPSMNMNPQGQANTLHNDLRAACPSALGWFQICSRLRELP
jgi:hypothetical protein